MKKTLSLAVVTALSLGLVGCGSSDSDSSAVDSVSKDITVERGAVYGATVKDASGSMALQKSNQNVYTFENKPVYPVTVKGGWIDVDNDGKMTSSDIELNIEMKSYSNVVTPISTYIADSDVTKREEKLQTLLALVNDGSGEDITAEDLLKVASKAPQKVQMAINAVYSEMIDSASTSFDTTEIISRMNDLKNINVDGLNEKEMAKKYEEYLVNFSDISTKLSYNKLTQNDLNKYNIPVIDIDSLKKDSKSILILNDFPLVSYESLSSLSSSYDGMNFYRSGAENASCDSAFSGYSNCNELSAKTMGYPSSIDSITVIGVYDIPNYVEDTSNAGITDIIGKTFYIIDTQYYSEYGQASYSKFTIDDFRDGEMSDNPSDKEYELVNGQWVEDTYNYDEDETEVITIVGDKLKIETTYLDDGESAYSEIIYLSIAEKTSTYWTIKMELESDSYNDTRYEKFYLNPTAEMLDASLVKAPAMKNNRVLSKVSKMRSKIRNYFR